MNKEHILRNLKYLHDKHKTENAVFKVRAYKKAINVISSYTSDITLEDLPTLDIGSRILEKVKTIITTGEDLSQFEETNITNKQSSISMLQTVHNIGNKKACELVEKHNITSIEELRTKQELLNVKQIAGLKYHDEIQQRIPREEIDIHREFLMATLANDNILTLTITGSYRRNEASSGDIDVLVCIKSHDKNVLKKLINQLGDYVPKTDGIFALGEKKFMGMCKLPECSTHRRIDIMLTTIDYYPFALLYFSGNSDFNVEMREYAIKKGYLLNEYGLFNIPEKMRKSAKSSKIKDVTSLEKQYINFDNSLNNEYLEACIFKTLELQYIEPPNRQSGNVLPL